MGNDAAIHQIDEKGRETSLHNMPAEHHDYAAGISLCRRDRAHDSEKIAGDENVGQGREKRGEAPVLPGGRRKLLGVNLVRAALDRNSTNPGEIGFRRAF